MKYLRNKVIRVAIPLLVGLILIGFLIYASNPAKIMEAVRTVNMYSLVIG
jgi:hypothetical protein